MATEEEFLATLPRGTGPRNPFDTTTRFDMGGGQYMLGGTIYDAQNRAIGAAEGVYSGAPQAGQTSSGGLQFMANQYFIDDNGDLKVIRAGDEDGTPQRPTAAEREEYAMSDPSRQRLVRNGVEYGIANPADFGLAADDSRAIQEGGKTWLPTALTGQLLAPFKHDSFLENFLTNLPITAGLGFGLAGVTGGLGALQGIPGNGLVNLPNIFNPSGTGGTSGSIATDTVTGGTAGDGLGAVLDTFGEGGGTGLSVLDPGGATLGLGEGLDLTGTGIEAGIGNTIGESIGTGLPIGAVTDEAGNVIGDAGGGFTGGGSGGDPTGGTGGGTISEGGNNPLWDILKGLGVSQSDLMRLLGGIGTGVAGWAAADSQGDAMRDIANQQNALAQQILGYGAPSRARYEGSFDPGFSMSNEPGYADALDLTTENLLRRSSTGGNPLNNPGAYADVLRNVNNTFAFPALQNYREQTRLGGQLGLPQATNLFGNAGQAGMAGANAAGGGWEAIGAGANQIFNPQPTLADIFRNYGLNYGSRP